MLAGVGGCLNPHPHLMETWNECNFFIAPSSGHNTSKLIAGKTEIPRDKSKLQVNSQKGFGRCRLSCLLHYIQYLSIPLQTNSWDDISRSFSWTIKCQVFLIILSGQNAWNNIDAKRLAFHKYWGFCLILCNFKVLVIHVEKICETNFFLWTFQ